MSFCQPFKSYNVKVRQTNKLSLCLQFQTCTVSTVHMLDLNPLSVQFIDSSLLDAFTGFVNSAMLGSWSRTSRSWHSPDFEPTRSLNHPVPGKDILTLNHRIVAESRDPVLGSWHSSDPELLYSTIGFWHSPDPEPPGSTQSSHPELPRSWQSPDPELPGSWQNPDPAPSGYWQKVMNHPDPGRVVILQRTDPQTILMKNVM
jgi:hypothetical protein